MVFRSTRLLVAAFLSVAALLLVLAGCQKNLAFSPPDDSVEGKWGGEGIRFSVESQFATVQFNCANGMIGAPVVIDSRGGFEVEGTYTTSPRGDGVRFRAIYKGTSGGATMTLMVVLPNEGLEIGPYSLSYGELGRIAPCGGP